MIHKDSLLLTSYAEPFTKYILLESGTGFTLKITHISNFLYDFFPLGSSQGLKQDSQIDTLINTYSWDMNLQNCINLQEDNHMGRQNHISATQLKLYFFLDIPHTFYFLCIMLIRRLLKISLCSLSVCCVSPFLYEWLCVSFHQQRWPATFTLWSPKLCLLSAYFSNTNQREIFFNYFSASAFQYCTSFTSSPIRPLTSPLPAPPFSLSLSNHP